MPSDFENQVAALAQAANTRDARLLEEFAAALEEESFPRVVAHFAFAHLDLALSVAVQRLTREKGFVELKREGGTRLTLHVAGKWITCQHFLDDDFIGISHLGFPYLMFGEEKWTPEPSLDPAVLHADASSRALQLCQRLLA